MDILHIYTEPCFLFWIRLVWGQRNMIRIVWSFCNLLRELGQPFGQQKSASKLYVQLTCILFSLSFFSLKKKNKNMRYIIIKHVDRIIISWIYNRISKDVWVHVCLRKKISHFYKKNKVFFKVCTLLQDTIKSSSVKHSKSYETSN